MTPSTARKWAQLTGPITGLTQRLGEISAVAICLQLVVITFPLFTQWVIDSSIATGDRELLNVIIFTFAFAIIFQLLSEITSGWASITLETQLGLQWSVKFMRHLTRLPLGWYDRHQTGDVMSRLQSLQAIQTAISSKLVETLIDVIFLSISLIIIIIYSPQLSAITLAATAIYIAIRLISFKQIRRFTQTQISNDAEMQTIFIENIQCMQTIKISSIENQRTKKWIDALLQSTNNHISLKKFALALSSAHSAAQGFETVLILGIGAVAVIDKQLTLGMLMAFVAYKTEFSNRAQKVVNNLVDFSMLKIHTDRLSEVLLATPEKISPENSEFSSQDEQNTFKKLELINICFRFNEHEKWILKNINLTINAGEHLVITGPTGCGKSTLSRIILGLTKPTSGEVKINGKTIDQMGLTQWRSYFSAVMQNDQLFATTIAENITHSKHIDEEKIFHASKIAQIDKDIFAMASGLHTILQPLGSNLSGGQRQRLSIARALYKNSPILVFDEATSHLDMATERNLNQSIKQLPVTIISIAHRPESIKAATREFSLA